MSSSTPMQGTTVVPRTLAMAAVSRIEACHRMNTWGQQRIPFIFIIDYRQQACIVCPLSEVDKDSLLFNFPLGNNVPTGSEVYHRHDAVRWQVEAPSFETYQRSFNLVRTHLWRGDSYLVNLTARMVVHTSLHLLDIFHRTSALYRLWLRDHLVCFSPEIFIRINSSGTISSYPMKGTISALLPRAEETLLADAKEAAEHATVVDLIRNELSKVATHVRVPRYRYIDRIETNRGPILQTSSEITGSLQPDFLLHLGDIVFSQLPAGSITGAPKPMTQNIIQRAEGYERGYYTGVMGIFDGSQLDSAVMIRLIDQVGEQLYFKAGGGITAQSQCSYEYEELLQKAYLPLR